MYSTLRNEFAWCIYNTVLKSNVFIRIYTKATLHLKLHRRKNYYNQINLKVSIIREGDHKLQVDNLELGVSVSSDVQARLGLQAPALARLCAAQAC